MKYKILAFKESKQNGRRQSYFDVNQWLFNKLR